MAGHQIWTKDSIGALTKVNSTTVQLAASTISIGGLQYDSGILQCTTVSNGAGGLDTGTIAANSKYYVYAVLDAGNPVNIWTDTGEAGFTLTEAIAPVSTDRTWFIRPDYYAPPRRIVVGLKTSIY